MIFKSIIPISAFLLSTAPLYADDILKNKEIVNYSEPLSTEITPAIKAEDSTLGGDPSIKTPSFIVPEGIKTVFDDPDSSTDDSESKNIAADEPGDSEPEDVLEDETASIDSAGDSLASLFDTLYIDMTKSVMPTTNMRITSPYGMRRYRIHKGIDIKVQVGDTIRAAFPGIIAKVRYERRGYGKYVVIQHENCGITRTVYAHLSKQLVTVGEEVKAGTPIGLGGNTGRSTGSHLHFETRVGDMPLDPAQFFDFENQKYTVSNYPLSLFKAKAEYASLQKEASQRRYHRIRPGETLSKIARREGVSIKTLCRLNGIKTTTKLRIGRSLRCS